MTRIGPSITEVVIEAWICGVAIYAGRGGTIGTDGVTLWSHAIAIGFTTPDGEKTVTEPTVWPTSHPTWPIVMVRRIKAAREALEAHGGLSVI